MLNVLCKKNKNKRVAPTSNFQLTTGQYFPSSPLPYTLTVHTYFNKQEQQVS